MDIAIRYNIRDVKSLKRLLLYLVANVGNLVTATKLTQSLGIKSSATILDYFSFFEQTYLLSLMPRFSYSYRAQLVNPRKIYVIDNGLINAVTPSFSKDYGRKLENVIYWSLRQQNKDLFYFSETGSECDFVVRRNNEVEELVQVCYDLTNENAAREQKGLLAAMTFFKKDKDTIISLNQSNEISNSGKHICVISVPSLICVDLSNHCHQCSIFVLSVLVPRTSYFFYCICFHYALYLLHNGNIKS